MVSFQKEDSCRDSFVSAVSVVPQEHSTVLQPGTNGAICHKLIIMSYAVVSWQGLSRLDTWPTQAWDFFPPSFVVFFLSYSPNNPLATEETFLPLTFLPSMHRHQLVIAEWAEQEGHALLAICKDAKKKARNCLRWKKISLFFFIIPNLRFLKRCKEMHSCKHTS